ncbi:hypothetical protein SBF1_1390003 [Candidatus Desulfosporosinus infrequens]|uniref:Uncharacterized protein n=1 Tax=Candidatus Desulfosporosinus infrequens TaxID=2043169 RepID=A0A2U3K515_9FIRM|nr:hypothetical protein SBF1_1390003 [Candidatus Desulfosporosinus infrequens]
MVSIFLHTRDIILLKLIRQLVDKKVNEEEFEKKSQIGGLANLRMKVELCLKNG